MTTCPTCSGSALVHPMSTQLDFTSHHITSHHITSHLPLVLQRALRAGSSHPKQLPTPIAAAVVAGRSSCNALLRPPHRPPPLLPPFPPYGTRTLQMRARRAQRWTPREGARRPLRASTRTWASSQATLRASRPWSRRLRLRVEGWTSPHHGRTRSWAKGPALKGEGANTQHAEPSAESKSAALDGSPFVVARTASPRRYKYRWCTWS